MRQAAHQVISPYGLRVVEPHHDACPHWHVLVFVRPEHAEVFAALMRSYALADSPNEPGAATHRFTVEYIDPAKGSAVGY
ncbi:replication endonuclease, partial [Acinetobacter baumannii]